MKQRVLLLFVTAMVALAGYAQVVGSWEGVLHLSPQYSLSLVIHITELDGELSATLDSPDQGATGIPVSEIGYNEGKLTFRSEKINANYEGTLANDTIKGFFVQNAFPLPLNLTRQKLGAEIEYSYIVEEVKIENPTAGVVLAGTLTKPLAEGKYPAVVLVAGSGPNNRDSKLFGHRPLYDIADYLTQQGIVVLRYDKRGVGESTGTFNASMIVDFVSDARAALEWLREQPFVEKAGIVGHSEGGLIAQNIAAEYPELTDYIVLLAAPGITGLETIVYQNVVMIGGFLKEGTEKDFEEITRKTFEKIQSEQSTRAADSVALRVYNKDVELLVADDKRAMLGDFFENEKQFMATLNGVTTPYYKAFLRVNPKDYLPRISCPILALNGQKDMQVEAKANLDAIESQAKSSAPMVITKSYENLNHLFIPAITGMPQEYPMLKEPFSAEVLSDIVDFINQFR